MTTPLRFTIENRVATLKLNRPEKLNAMTPEMAGLLASAVADINDNDEVRAVILTGAGEKSFCVGSDIADLDRYSSPWAFRNRTEYCDLLRRLHKPVIAAINGYALGGGLEMALSCDIRLSAENARFGAPEIKLGWIGGGGMSAHLMHAVGPSNAALMVLTGDPVDAAQALQWGLVSEVMPATDLLPRAQELAAKIAERAPIAAETARINLHASLNMPLEQAINYERDLQTICFATEDAAEGCAAFMEKRLPQFQRR